MKIYEFKFKDGNIFMFVIAESKSDAKIIALEKAVSEGIDISDYEIIAESNISVPQVFEVIYCK